MIPELRNKLQSSKTVLEKLKAGVVPSKELVEVALRDLGSSLSRSSIPRVEQPWTHISTKKRIKDK